jgi:hypothetical protein
MTTPKHLAELGILTELKLEKMGYLISFTFPKTGKNVMILATDSAGKKVFGLRGKIGKKQSMSFPGKVADRYTDWSEYEATTQRTIKVTDKKTFNVGRAISLTYISDKWDGKHEYFHDFETKCTVHMDCDEDPEKIIISGRSLIVTEKGIEG